MSRKKTTTMGVLSAVTSLAVAPAAATAATSEPAVPPAHSFAELLEPIPNAQARLQRADLEAMQRPVQVIETQYAAHHHHHHSHYRRDRAWYLNHGYVWSGRGWVLRPVRHHHHHHHHNNY